MSWKSLICAALLGVLVVGPAFAQTLNVSRVYNQSMGVIEWTVSVGQATPGDGSSLAVELPFTLAPASAGFATFVNAGADKTNAAANGSWYFNESAAGSGTLLWNTQQSAADEEQNPGNNPFTGTVTEGLQVDTTGKTVFAALGSDINLPDPVPTLHIASSDGVLNWSNAVLAENGAQVTRTGSMSSVVAADLNGDGLTNFGDLTPFVSALTNAGGYATQFPGLDRVARCDVSGDGACNFGDLTPFVGVLTGGPGAGAGLASAAVPEPTSVFLAILGGLIVAARRGRQ
jgi:hypothetical protein